MKKHQNDYSQEPNITRNDHTILLLLRAVLETRNHSKGSERKREIERNT